MKKDLFRVEVQDYRSQRLEGDANLGTPVSWHILAYFLCAVVVVAFIVMFSLTYSRTVTARGVLVPSGGLAVVLPYRAGVVSEVLVTEGEFVRKGQPLARVVSDEVSGDGGSVVDQLLSAISSESDRIASQAVSLDQAASADVRRLLEQADGFAAEVASLGSQMQIQAVLVDSARDDFERAAVVAERGFLSRDSLRRREEALLSRQQTMQQLEQTLASRRAQYASSLQGVEQIKADRASQNEALQATRAALAQKMLTTQSSREYLLPAPIEGVTASLTVRTGHPAITSTPMMSIVPRASRMQVELAVPAAAIAFVDVGQEVRLRVDALPHQKFGTVRAWITSVSEAPLNRPETGGPEGSVYLVIGRIEADDMRAFGEARSFRSGMTVTASIQTRRQSLLETIFEPAYAVGRR